MSQREESCDSSCMESASTLSTNVDEDCDLAQAMVSKNSSSEKEEAVSLSRKSSSAGANNVGNIVAIPSQPHEQGTAVAKVSSAGVNPRQKEVEKKMRNDGNSFGTDVRAFILR